MDTKKLYVLFHECYRDKVPVDEVITFVRNNSTNTEQQVKQGAGRGPVRGWKGVQCMFFVNL